MDIFLICTAQEISATNSAFFLKSGKIWEKFLKNWFFIPQLRYFWEKYNPMRVFFAVLLIFVFKSTFSQVTVSDAELMFLSRHVWRGSQLGNAPVIEPSVTLSAGNFSFNFWAAKTTNKSYAEIDLIPSWQFKHFAVTVYDYYNPVPGEENDFFDFGKENSRHSLELSLDNYYTETGRFKWMVGTFATGDKNEDTGKPNFSTYIEFKYPFSVAGIEAEPFAGLTPFKGFYAGSFAIVNSGLSLTKSVEITGKLFIPLNITYYYNPYADKNMLTFGTGIVFSSED